MEVGSQAAADIPGLEDNVFLMKIHEDLAVSHDLRWLALVPSLRFASIFIQFSVDMGCLMPVLMCCAAMQKSMKSVCSRRVLLMSAKYLKTAPIVTVVVLCR